MRKRNKIFQQLSQKRKKKKQYNSKAMNEDNTIKYQDLQNIMMNR